ncbi:MAG: phage portal protein [Actinomycetota bacterium]
MGLFRRKAKPDAVELKWPFDVFDTLTEAYTNVSPGLSAIITRGLAGSESYDWIFRSHPAVYTVVEFLAAQVAAVGLKVYRRVSDTDRVEITSGQLVDLLREPAPGLTYTPWMHGWVADRCVFGNAYFRKIGSGAARALQPLPPIRVQPRGGGLIQAGSYDFMTGQTITNIPAEQMVHSRRYNPTDARIGVSPLEPLRAVLRSDAAALQHWETLWKNGARAHGWIKLPAESELSETGLKRLRESLQQSYAGTRNAGKVGVLEGGADFVADAWDPRESQFIEGRTLTLETVARALNVPLAVLSLTDSATYASQSEFHKQLYVDTLGPWFSLIEEELEAYVLPWLGVDPDTYVEFNVESKLRGSFEEQVVALRNAVGVPILSVNEARALQNRPRIDDPEFDIPVKPSNVLYGDAQAPGEAPMPAVRGSDNVVPIASGGNNP